MRHEFRFRPREVAILAGVSILICGLTFALGVLVGRELGATARSSATTAAAEPTRAARPGRPEKTAIEERLTFYQTLTAPTPELPATGQPAVEEQLVPRDAPPGSALPAGPPTPKAPSKPERRAESGGATAAERGGSGRPKATAGQAPPAAASAAAAAPAAVPADPQVWTVQVSSFRSRALADDLRARLAAQGFDAYVVSMSGEEGRVRHRVRVGGYVTRGEAERVAQELRGERNVNPFVTTRTR